MNLRSGRSKKNEATSQDSPAKQGPSTDQSNISNGTEEFDPQSFATPYDLTKHLDKAFYQNLKSAKWLERKNAIQGLIDIMMKNPVLKPKKPKLKVLIGELTKLLTKDKKVDVVSAAATALSKLACGSADIFKHDASSVILQCLTRMKDLKPAIQNACSECIDKAYATMTFANVLEPIKAGLALKAPGSKVQSCEFFTRIMLKVEFATVKGSVAATKEIIEELCKLALGSDVGCREAAMRSLATFSMQFAVPLLTELADEDENFNDSANMKSLTFCDKCKMNQRSAYALSMHYTSCKGIVDRSFKCDVTGCKYKGGPTKEALRKHKSRNHQGWKKCLSCRICFKDLDSHMKNCLKKPTFCNHCQHDFSKPVNYDRHRKDFKYEIDNLDAKCDFSKALDELIDDNSMISECKLQFIRLQNEFKVEKQRHSSTYIFLDPQQLTGKSSFHEFSTAIFRVGSSSQLYTRKASHKFWSTDVDYTKVHGLEEFHDKLNEIWKRKKKNTIFVLSLDELAEKEAPVVEGSVIEALTTTKLTNKFRGTPTVKFGFDRHKFAQAGSFAINQLYVAFLKGEYDEWSRDDVESIDLMDAKEQ